MKNTYSLLLNSNAEEKGRSIFETAVYGLVVACCAVSAWQFASGEVVLPSGSSAAAKVAVSAPAQQSASLRG